MSIYSIITSARKLVVPACVVTLTACASTSAESPAGQQAVARTVPASSIEFAQVAPFVRMGAAWGDRAQGAHGTFGVFPAGARSPMHTHSGAYHGVVISGTMTNPFEGEANPPPMAAGSYWYVPAGKAHVTACISQEPCNFYFHADGAFDFAPSQ